MQSFIIITNDFKKAKVDICKEYDNNFVRYFEEDSFLLEHAKEVVKEAYIKENQTKYIVLIAKSYNLYAQNSLLKILEEPPTNIVFYILVNNISSMLPTVQSRMVIQKKFYETENIDIGVDITTLDLEFIYEYTKKNRYMKSNELKTTIEILFQKAIKNGIVFSKSELDNFDTLFKLSTLYGNAFNILLSVLLMIYDKKS